MSYLIHYEESTGKYHARSQREPIAAGVGNCLYSAVDDLELKIQELQLRETSVNKTKALNEPLLVVRVS
ncbi:MAG: hypothetical protein OK457_07205 [Thaumarchaeota archaeon]|nr:hypothetical protein [Nitrososphaerota archaeon]